MAIQDLLTGMLLAPVVLMGSVLSLTLFTRAIDFVANFATKPQTGILNDIKPYVKHIYTNILSRVDMGSLGKAAASSTSKSSSAASVAGSFSATNVLLMGVIICILALVMKEAEAAPAASSSTKRTATVPKREADKRD